MIRCDEIRCDETRYDEMRFESYELQADRLISVGDMRLSELTFTYVDGFSKARLVARCWVASFAYGGP